jgi:hypothetical protein
MDKEQVTNETLVAYADGELDAETRESLERFLPESEELLVKVAQYKQTSDLLLTEFYDKNAQAPKRIAVKIKQIDHEIKTAKQKPDKSLRIGKIRDLISWKTVYSTAAAFFLGAILSPALFEATTFISQTKMKSGEVASSMQRPILRGPESSGSFVEVLVKQNDNVFDSSSSIKANQPFHFIINTPIRASITLLEIEEEEKPEEIYTSGGAVDANTYVSLPAMMVDPQVELKVIVVLENSDTVINYRESFSVFE